MLEHAFHRDTQSLEPTSAILKSEKTSSPFRQLATTNAGVLGTGTRFDGKCGFERFNTSTSDDSWKSVHYYTRLVMPSIGENTHRSVFKNDLHCHRQNARKKTLILLQCYEVHKICSRWSNWQRWGKFQHNDFFEDRRISKLCIFWRSKYILFDNR